MAKEGKAGASATEKSHDVEFAKGGKTHMFGEQAAEPAEKGETADTSATDNAPGDKFAGGGKGKMFGFSPSKTATAGITSAY